MANYLNPNISNEGILSIGDNVLYTCPNNYTASFSGLRFSSPSAYDISIRIERVSPAATITYYSFTLDAGDVVTDSGGYFLRSGDQIIVNTNVADVTYFFSGQVLPFIINEKQP